MSYETMEDLLKLSPTQLSIGDQIDGTVIAFEKRKVWVDLHSNGTGVILGSEADIQSKKLKIGEELSFSIVEPKTDQGIVVLSLKKVYKEKGWDQLESLVNSGEIITVVPHDSNKGGLLIDVEGVRGFLPVSQLSSKNYPRVSGNDKDQIIGKLAKLVGAEIKVKILDANRKDNKLIVSEREAMKDEVAKELTSLTVGDTVEAAITGIVDFGVFVNVNGVEGLVHISEISWDRVDNPSKVLKVDEKVKAKIIAIDHDKLSLSIKQLTEDPWIEESKKWKVDDIVEGSVTRITPFGAFVQITPSVEALVHISEIADEHIASIKDIIDVGNQYKFRVIAIDPSQHKLSLSLKGVDSSTAKKTAKRKTKDTEDKKEETAS